MTTLSPWMPVWIAVGCLVLVWLLFADRTED